MTRSSGIGRSATVERAPVALRGLGIGFKVARPRVHVLSREVVAMRSACYPADDLSDAVESCTRAMTRLMMMPVRLCAKGATTFERTYWRGSGYGRCHSQCDPCADDCGPRCDPCDPCGDSCGCTSKCSDSRDSCCHEPRCGRRGGRLKQGDEVVTNSGLVGTVAAIDDCYVTIDVGLGRPIKMTRSSICKVREALVPDRSRVLTHSGIIGTVTHVAGNVVTIDSGGTMLQIDRKAICKVLEESEHPIE